MSTTPTDDAVAAFAAHYNLPLIAASDILNKKTPEERECWRRVARGVLASAEERKRQNARRFGALVLTP